ncbi:MAG: hypothetical protein WBP59_09765 [Ilumatobacteraceae bacterium]
MKFWLGFSVGAAFASMLTLNMTLSQRQRIGSSVRSVGSTLRSSSSGESIGSVVSAVDDRVSTSIDETVLPIVAVD